MAFGYVLEKKLPVEIDERLLKKLADVATDGFGKEMSYGDVKSHVKESDGIFIAYVKELCGPLGFASYKINGNIGHLLGAVVRKDFHGKGIYKELNRRRIEEFRMNDIEYVVTRTQNPLVYLDVSKYCSELFPEENEKPTKNVLEIARKIYPACDDSLIIRRCYGSKMADDYITPNNEIRKLFSKLDVENGDAFVIVGMLFFSSEYHSCYGIPEQRLK